MGPPRAARPGPARLPVLTGNDLAIDMVMYGSDYLLGLSTFAPEAFALARPVLGDRRPALLRAQRSAAVPRRVHVPRPRPGVPPRRGDLLRAPRLGPVRWHARRWCLGGPRPIAPCWPTSSSGCRSGARERECSLHPGQEARLGRGVPGALCRARRRDPDRTTLSTDVGSLASPVDDQRWRRRTLVSPNRFAVLPMEGWDGTTDGRPTDLVRRRWQRFASSGCGLVWGEATAVRPDGRANPNQLVLDETTVDDIAALRGLLDRGQVSGIQLTHSGRWSRPDGRAAAAHRLRPSRCSTDASESTTARSCPTTNSMRLPTTTSQRPYSSQQAGFDFVDVKHCHGYLLHELLSGVRPRGSLRR